jgi:hypothetical protein
MSSKLSLPVSAWGFTAAELETWPLTLKPKLVADGPFVGAVVVHARAAQSFIAAAEAYPQADGSLVPALLYDPCDVALAPGSIVCFAAVVDAANVDDLEELLACPEHFTMTEYAEELPNRYLVQLRQPIATVAAQALPLPANVIAHLAVCPTCRAAFDAAVAARQLWQRMVFCPSPKDLHAYLLGAELPAVAQHLAGCTQCQAEAMVARHSLAREWLTIQLSHHKAVTTATRQRAPFHANAHTSSDAQWSALGILLQGLLAARLQPAGVQAWRRLAGSPAEQLSMEMMIEALLQGNEIKLTRPYRELSIQLAPDQNAVAFSALHGDRQRAVDDFDVELWGDEGIRWRGQSEAGTAVVPLAPLQEAIGQGAVRLVVRMLPQEDPPMATVA